MSKRSPLVCVLALLPLARGMVAVIPFYQKCIVPTFPPDPEGEGSGLLSCCAPEKRRFPSLVLQNALNYREVHVKDPLVQLTEQVVEAAILDHRLPGAPSSSEEEQDFDTAALRRRESLLPDQGQQVLDALPCALRSRIRVVKRLVDAYDSGVDELQNILRQLVRHMCFAVGSELTPDLSPMLNAFNELRTALSEREDLERCPQDHALFLGPERLMTELLEPNLHNIQSIDELPLPKNWTMQSNWKIWEDVRLEDPMDVNSSSVMAYEGYGHNYDTFLTDFVESSAVKLGTPVSVLLNELRALVGMVGAGAHDAGADQGGARAKMALSGDAEETTDEELAELDSAVPSLAQIRPSAEAIQEFKDARRNKLTVLFPTESTMSEVSQDMVLHTLTGTVRQHIAPWPEEVGHVEEEKEKTKAGEEDAVVLPSDSVHKGKGADGDAGEGADVEKSSVAAEDGAISAPEPEDDEEQGLTTLLEISRVRQYTRQSPTICLALVREQLIDHYNETQKVECRWLRYPEASDVSPIIVGQHLSSIGIRTSEETRIYQSAHLTSRNADFHRSIFNEYVRLHQMWRSDPESSALSGAIVAVCYGLPFCGGHGDRIHGILSLFLLAVATGRGFLIDSRAPLPLLQAVHPNFVDWRVRVEEIELNNRVQLVDLSEDALEKALRGFRRSPAVLALGTNLRFHHYITKWLNEQYGYFALTSTWVSDAWNYLFKPSPAIMRVLRDNSPRKSFVAMHFRAGNETQNFVDPPRHALGLIDEFMRCAAKVRRDLSALVDPATPVYLSADTAKIWSHPSVARAVETGFLQPLLKDREGEVIHVDRTSAGHSFVQDGFMDSWAEYISLSRATALVISNSFFGETAAEIGHVPFVFYGEGCIPVDL